MVRLDYALNTIHRISSLRLLFGMFAFQRIFRNSTFVFSAKFFKHFFTKGRKHIL